MIQSFLGFLGRALISLIFIVSAVHKILDWQGSERFFTQILTDWLPLTLGKPWMQEMLDWSLAHTGLLLLLATLFELIGGLMVFLGLWTRLGAFLLLCFIVPVTLVFHHFWNLQEALHQIEMVNFMKNLSIMGGLLFILARGKCDSPCKTNSKD